MQKEKNKPIESPDSTPPNKPIVPSKPDETIIPEKPKPNEPPIKDAPAADPVSTESSPLPDSGQAGNTSQEKNRQQSI